MDANQKALLAEAANALIEDSDAAVIYKQMLGVHELARKGVPVRLIGRCAVLNPLLELMLDDFDAAERVIELIERKRSDAGNSPLDNEGFDRKAYMRELMATKRERQRRLVELINMLRPDRERLKGATRMEFERVHANRWFEVRNEREDDLREKLGRRLTNDERMGIIRQLWADVDAELAELDEFVRSEMRKPLHSRAPAGFKFKLQPKKGRP